MTGMVMFNPILGRRNIPIMVQVGLSFVLGVALLGVVPPPEVIQPDLLAFLPFVAIELAIGMVTGLIMHMFLSIFVIGGDVMDMQMGLAMAKAFDPGSGAQISLSTQFLNIMFILIFFLTNSHLTLIRYAAISFRIIPVGAGRISADALYHVPEMMIVMFLFGIKLALPVLLVAVITTMSVGIVMRIVPQINIFVLQIQIKLALGVFMLFVMVPFFANFIETLIMHLYERIAESWMFLR
jgi:flagellar biosynthetic protein FliR